MVGRKSLPQSFLDSDQAVAEAGKNGFSEKSGDIRMSLDDQQRGLRESFCWTIADEDGKLFINAESGTLLGTM
jgi:hypothetical protein